MTNRIHRSAPKSLGIALAAGVAALTLGALPQDAAAQAAQATGQDMQVSIGGQQMQASALVGSQVMLKGERIGEVVDLIGRDNTYNDVIVRLDEEHSQMGLVLGAAEAGMEGNQRPIIVGGHTVAVPFESFSAAEGDALQLSESAVTTLDQFRTTGGQDFYTYQRGQTAEIGPYESDVLGTAQ